MGCLHPLKAIPIGVRSDTGRTNYKIVPYSWSDPSGMTEYIEIPCGTCINCRKHAAYEWQQRAVCELQSYDKASFITLTYDQEHIPTNSEGVGTLQYTDFQKFMKRLRRRHEELDIRYFACGEYGSRTFRPHFHAIIYGYDFPDRQFMQKSKKGGLLYSSEELSCLWPFGRVTASDVNAATCGYVAGYISSKIGKYSNDKYKFLGVMPPKLFASKRPALGLRWFQDHVDDYLSTDVQFVRTENGSFSVGLPKYFMKKLEEYNESLYNQIKDSNKVKGEYLRQTILAQTDLSYEELLKNEEVLAQAKLKSHMREV